MILFSLNGTIVRGKGKGRGVGMPTANLRVAGEVPGRGVYATVVHIGGERYYGVTNIGERPSVDSSEEITVETYIMDFTGDLYGRAAAIDFFLYIRGIRKFASLEDVKKQVESDINTAKEFFDRAELHFTPETNG